MRNCPLCGAENRAGLACASCGYDRSCDYERIGRRSRSEMGSSPSRAAAGRPHLAADGSGGRVLAAGRNRKGQCDVGQWTGIISVAADKDFTVGLRADGRAVAAGGNFFHQCEVAGRFRFALPECPAENGSRVAAITAAGNCAVFLHADGTLSLLGEGDRSIASAESWTGLPVPAGS